MIVGMPEGHGLAPEVLAIPALVPTEASQPKLTDIQYAALEQGVGRGASLIVSAPTSTGKTLIGLWTIASAITSGARAVYLVSHRALARQKFEEIRSVFLDPLLDGDPTTIVLATGDGVEDATGRRLSNPLDGRILVATYEKFLHSLAVAGPPQNMQDLCLVCDEIQIIGDEHRGRHIELLLTLMKKAGWRQFVGLSAVLAPNDAAELADWLGVEVLRNPKREKSLRVECRAPNQVIEVVVSADHGSSGVQTVRQSKTRDTIRIVQELVGREQGLPVIVFCMRIDDTYQLANAWVATLTSPASPIDRPAGAEVSGELLAALSRRAAYHNAELGEDERELVEARLQSGDVDVVFATTTLAAGVNFPLGSAVFDRWKRYNFTRRVHEPISRPEFQNMAGRVGRMGQAASEGLVVMTASNAGEINAASQLMDVDTPDELTSRIGPDDFGQLLLHMFAGGLCDTRADAYEMIAGTFSAAREAASNRAGLASWEDKVNAEIDALIGEECLVEARRITPTLFGVTVAHTGLKPATANWMLEELYARADDLVAFLPSQSSSGSEDDLLFILAHAALCSPEYTFEGGRPTRNHHWRLSADGLAANPWARRLSQSVLNRPWTADVPAANAALLLAAWATGQARSHIEGLVDGVRLGSIQTAARDASWVISGIAEIIGRISAPTLAEEELPTALRGDPSRLAHLRILSRTCRRQASRIALGLPSDVLWMSSLDQKGPRSRLTRPEILALKQAGLTMPLDLMRGDPEVEDARREALRSVGTVDGGASSRLRDAARSWKMKERKFCRQLHERVTSGFDGGALVRSLYTARGDDLETVLEDAFAQIGQRFTKLDIPKTQGRPDYLLELDGCPPIVVEVKTKEDDRGLVGLNAASEVLTASELMGRKDTTCLTICSPAVDPGVPVQIEACRRLCVVDICDLTDAITKCINGELSAADLHNWLTTPGIALMADLPRGLAQ